MSSVLCKLLETQTHCNNIFSQSTMKEKISVGCKRWLRYHFIIFINICVLCDNHLSESQDIFLSGIILKYFGGVSYMNINCIYIISTSPIPNPPLMPPPAQIYDLIFIIVTFHILTHACTLIYNIYILTRSYICKT